MITSFKEIEAVSTSPRAAWEKVRKLLREGPAKSDSQRLFNAAIKEMQWHLNNTGSIDSVEYLYESIVSEFVNNPRSKFYIYG